MTTREKLEAIERYFAQDSVKAEIAAIAAGVSRYYLGIDDEGELEDLASMLTIGADCDDDGNVTWSWQSGDNSYSGSAYPYPYWGVCYFSPDMSATDYAEAVIDDLVQALPW